MWGQFWQDKFKTRWLNWKPTSYDVNTMDALIVAIQMVLIGRIFHLAKPYMYSFLLENKPTAIYSHLSRNKKCKLWVGWHGSSWWLLCLCVLWFVFCAASKIIQCSRVSAYFIFWKMKIKSYVFWQISSSIILQLEKNMTGKKRYCVSFFGQCSRMSPYFIFWKINIMSYVFWHVSLSKLWLEKITTGKKVLC